MQSARNSNTGSERTDTSSQNYAVPQKNAQKGTCNKTNSIQHQYTAHNITLDSLEIDWFPNLCMYANMQKNTRVS